MPDCSVLSERRVGPSQYLWRSTKRPKRKESTLINLTGVISKATVGNSSDILDAIVGHRYHQNHSNRAISVSLMTLIK